MIQNATFKYLMQQIESRHSIKSMYNHVYSQNKGASQVFTDGWMDKKHAMEYYSA